MLMHRLCCQAPVCHSAEESRKQHPSQDTHQERLTPLTAEPQDPTTQPRLLSTTLRTLLPSGEDQIPWQSPTQGSHEGGWERSGQDPWLQQAFPQNIPHRPLPGRSLTLVELGVAQEEGAVENGQYPAEGQQVKDADRAQQCPIKPGKEQQDTAVTTEHLTPHTSPLPSSGPPPALSKDQTHQTQVHRLGQVPLPSEPTAGCLTRHYSLGRDSGVLPVQYTVHRLAAAAHPAQEPLQLDQAANETSQSHKGPTNPYPGSPTLIRFTVARLAGAQALRGPRGAIPAAEAPGAPQPGGLRRLTSS